METFLRAFLVVVGLLMVAGAPVLVVSWRLKRKRITRGFVTTAVLIAVFFGLAAVTSDSLISQCGESGGIACLDVGYQGLLFLVTVVYLAASVIVALSLGRR